MNKLKIYTFLQKQILMMTFLSLLPGLAYIVLGWLNGVVYPALVWYGLMVMVSVYGWKYYKINLKMLGNEALVQWYSSVTLYFYMIFGLWTLIFLLYAGESESHLHYIAIFTQLGASVVASTLLVSDKKLFFPVLLILMVPLVGYFALIGEWYGYVLAVFSVIFLGVLLYSSDNSYKLIQENYYQAQHDSLTGLYNRRYFVDYIERMINRIQYSKKFAYVLLIDLDHFKTINDTLGHDIGDKVLIAVAKRITDYCGKEHVVSRLGGDEFTILSPEYDESVNCQEIAYVFSEKLLKKLKEPYHIDNHNLYLSASIGINGIGNVDIGSRHFIKEADIAMYEAKEQGRDGIIIFNDELAQRVKQHLEIERKLYFALKYDEIILSYQPQFDANENIIGVEVLVRWDSRDFGLVMPGEFIPIAEKTGLIIELGNHIIEEVFKTMKEWDEMGIVLQQCAINLSVRQFFHTSFTDEIERLSNKYLNEECRKKIIFEVTESILIEDMNKIVNVMNKLRKLGFSFSMDDFGTGYSSLTYLKDIPADYLKIDMSFVTQIGKDFSDEMILVLILSMKTVFNVNIVAEGIETKEQYEFLVDNGCHIFQGYYFSKPLTQEAFETLYLDTHLETTLGTIS